MVPPCRNGGNVGKAGRHSSLPESLIAPGYDSSIAFERQAMRGVVSLTGRNGHDVTESAGHVELAESVISPCDYFSVNNNQVKITARCDGSNVRNTRR